MRSKRQSSSHLEPLNVNAAGIDVGSDTHSVCIPADRATENVRRFGCFTAELKALAYWLQACGVQGVAMESTGVYWIPLFQILETGGNES